MDCAVEMARSWKHLQFRCCLDAMRVFVDNERHDSVHAVGAVNRSRRFLMYKHFATTFNYHARHPMPPCYDRVNL
jgi:hypothetical protein